MIVVFTMKQSEQPVEKPDCDGHFTNNKENSNERRERRGETRGIERDSEKLRGIERN
jgi:hypothetical protein